jgi:hypothetical protein
MGTAVGPPRAQRGLGLGERGKPTFREAHSREQEVQAAVPDHPETIGGMNE